METIAQENNFSVLLDNAITWYVSNGDKKVAMGLYDGTGEDAPKLYAWGKNDTTYGEPVTIEEALQEARTMSDWIEDATEDLVSSAQ